jgi:hypothetical protein
MIATCPSIFAFCPLSSVLLFPRGILAADSQDFTAVAMTSPRFARERERPLRRPPPRRRRGPRALVLPLVVFAAVAIAATAYIAYVLWPRWPGPAAGPTAPALPITVAGVTFNVPPAAIRAPMQRRPGMYDRIDLSFLWPSLDPPDANAKPSVPAQGALPAPTPTFERIFVTIVAGGNSVPPAERVLTIYPRYTAAEGSPGPDGLTILAFRDGTPYQGEDLIYDAEGPGFLVRCTRRVGPTPGTCLYERWIDTVKLVMRFPRDWLADWRAVAGNIDRLIASLRLSRG